MWLLGIETATASQSVALLQDQEVLAEASWSATDTRGGKLLPMIDSVLRQAGLVPGSIDAIAVSVGPGSFTGVRVGLATAKGLVLGTSACLVDVSTLEALAAGYDMRKGTLCALLHAGRGELYAALYSLGDDSELQAICPAFVLSPEAVASRALALITGEIHLIGDGVVRHRDRLEAAFQGRGRITDDGLSAVPSATMVARLAFARMKSATTELPRHKEIVPVYLRRAEAELNWEKGLVGSSLARLAKAAR